MASNGRVRRNGQIDFWRFIGIVMIVIGHSNKLLSTPPLQDVFAVWVDYFFIVTGFFMACTIEKMACPCDANTLGTETLAYTMKKIKSFYLFFIFASFTALCAKVVLHGFEEVFMNSKLLSSINDFLLIYATGIPSMSVTVGEWYLSAMVLAILIIYPIARRNPNLFKNVIGLLLGVFLYGIMLHNEGRVTDPGTWYHIGLKGVIRAIAGISLGFVANQLVASIKKSNVFDNKVGVVLITIIDIIAIPFATFLMIKGINPKYSSVIIFFLFVGVVTSLSEKSAFTKVFSFKPIIFLGKLSLPVFLCQGTIIYLIKAYQKHNVEFELYCNSAKGMPVMLAILVIGTIVLALICLAICEPLMRLFDNWLLKLGKKQQ